MPLFGELDLDQALGSKPTVTGLTPETWELPGAETLQVSFEVDEAAALSITPPALHPSIPPYATFSVVRFPESPVGPFNLAMVRLIVRAGIRPRGLLVTAFTDSDAAADALRSGWGYDVAVANVGFSHRHNRIQGTVAIDGNVVMDARLEDPEPVAGSDLELFDNLHLVNHQPVGSDDVDPLIIQVDPGYTYSQAERGAPGLEHFDAAALGATGISPVYGVVAVACVADMELAAPRFVIDPTVPAVQGTRRLHPSGA